MDEAAERTELLVRGLRGEKGQGRRAGCRHRELRDQGRRRLSPHPQPPDAAIIAIIQTPATRRNRWPRNRSCMMAS